MVLLGHIQGAKEDRIVLAPDLSENLANADKCDFSLVKVPVFDEDGYPVQKRGVSEYPGLCFVGLPFLHTSRSGLLAGVGDDAEHVASAIASK